MNPFVSRKILFTTLLTLAVVLLASCSPAALPQTGAGQQVALDITDSAVTTPQSATPGITTITVTNSRQDSRSLALARLNTGVTLEQFTQALAQGPEGAVELVALAAGLETPPGETQEVTVDLKEGTYVALGLPENDDPPVVGTFPVSGAAAGQTAEPEAVVSVDMRDFQFVMPEQVPAGEQTWEFTNSGNQWHHMVVLRLHEGVTQEDILAMIESGEEPQGPPPFDEVAYFGPQTQGERAWMDINLEPGNYTAICFLPDLATGESHAEKGMIRSFEVQAP